MMMKFTCNTGELNQGINSALLAVSPKSTLLALEGILVRVTTKEITLMSYNLEMGITAIVDAKNLRFPKNIPAFFPFRLHSRQGLFGYHPPHRK